MKPGSSWKCWFIYFFLSRKSQTYQSQTECQLCHLSNYKPEAWLSQNGSLSRPPVWPKFSPPHSLSKNPDPHCQFPHTNSTLTNRGGCRDVTHSPWRTSLSARDQWWSFERDSSFGIYTEVGVYHINPILSWCSKRSDIVNWSLSVPLSLQMESVWLAWSSLGALGPAVNMSLMDISKIFSLLQPKEEDEDKEQCQALSSAVSTDDVTLLSELLSQENYRRYINTPSGWGVPVTPLRTAAALGHLRCLELLLEHGAEVRYRVHAFIVKLYLLVMLKQKQS